jgi:hypothetical protein
VGFKIEVIVIVYIAGPMTGYEKLNKPAFDQAKEYLNSEFAGMAQVIIPHDIIPVHLNGLMPLEMYIRVDVDVVLSSSLVFMLEGWQISKGATAEHYVAKWAGKQIRYQGETA